MPTLKSLITAALQQLSEEEREDRGLLHDLLAGFLPDAWAVLLAGAALAGQDRLVTQARVATPVLAFRVAESRKGVTLARRAGEDQIQVDGGAVVGVDPAEKGRDHRAIVAPLRAIPSVAAQPEHQAY